MDRTEQELREEYFDGPESDYKSYAQFLLDKGFPDLANKERENIPKIGIKDGGYVKEKAKNKSRGARKATRGTKFRGVR